MLDDEPFVLKAERLKPFKHFVYKDIMGQCAIISLPNFCTGQGVVEAYVSPQAACKLAALL